MVSPIGGFSSQNISPSIPLTSAAELGSVHKAPEAAPGGFQSMMIGALSEAGQMDAKAQHAIQESLLGGDISQAEVFSAVKKADLAMKTMVQLRNKIVDAYQEIQQLRM